MNYFAHGRRFVDSPYFLAGTAVPDWLNIADRRVRVRGKHATPFADDADSRIAGLARGILQHHRDDAWFHGTWAFVEMSLEMTVLLRDALPEDRGFRPSFLGHILVELLLDSVLIAQQPRTLDAYYETLETVDPAVVQAAVNQMAPRPTQGLQELIPRFLAARFLPDYAEDGKLWFRLNQVMSRVGLPALPASFCDVLPQARRRVRDRWRELAASPEEPDNNDLAARTPVLHRLDPRETTA